MEILSQLLPIIIDVLLIIVIIVGIILGIKIIITIDKVEKLIEEVHGKFTRVAPIFDMVGMVGDKVTGVVSTVISSIENLALKIFTKKKHEERESEIDE